MASAAPTAVINSGIDLRTTFATATGTETSWGGGGADEQAASNALAASPAAIGKKRQCFESTMLWRRVVPVPANYR